MLKKKQEEAKAKAQKQMQQSSGGGGGGNNGGRNNTAGGGGGGGNRAQVATPLIKQAMSTVGDRLVKSEVKDLRQTGYTKQQVQQVATTVGAVSKGAQRKLGNGGNNSGGAGGGGRNVTAISSGDTGRLDNKGRLIAGFPYTPTSARDSNYLSPTEQSTEKINNYLGKTGYSLRGGNGRKVVGFKSIDTTGYSNALANPNSGGIHIPGGRETLAIYGPSRKERRADRNGDRNRERSGGSRTATPATAGSGPATAVERTRQYAEDRLYGRVPEGVRPEMFPEGAQVEGRASEAVGDYANRLDVYNQNTMGWMDDRAVASQYESGQFLRNFAAGLPKAPDVMSTDEMFRAARRFSNIDYT